MRGIVNHVLEYGNRVVLFREKDAHGKINARNYLIRGEKLISTRIAHQGRRLVYIDLGTEARFQEIEKRIRLVFDHDGVLIARRVSPAAPLRLTGKGMGKIVKKPSKTLSVNERIMK